MYKYFRSGYWERFSHILLILERKMNFKFFGINAAAGQIYINLRHIVTVGQHTQGTSVVAGKCDITLITGEKIIVNGFVENVRTNIERFATDNQINS
jgi:uncharacterized protein YlzI (FlbEa/FlbD family)